MTPAVSLPLLEVDGLCTSFDTVAGTVRSVDGVSWQLAAGETLGIVGESGCGKSVTALSIMRLVPTPPGRHAGAVRYRGTDLLHLPEKAMRGIRGDRISMIFQEPMTSLNPVLTVGRQIAETVTLHQKLSRRAAQARAIEMLRLVQIAAPDRMRGRVAAVNSIFIGTSNEIGAFESGVAAKLLGTGPSVVAGGCLTLATVAAAALFAPKLREMDLDGLRR